MRNAESLKAITARMVDLVGGQKPAAKICGVSVNTISVWCNNNYPHATRFIPLNRLMALDAAAGHVFLKEFARTSGFEIVALEGSQGPEPICVPSLIGIFAKDCGEFQCTALVAAADGQFTAAEKRRIRDDLAPVKNTIDQLEQAFL